MKVLLVVPGARGREVRKVRSILQRQVRQFRRKKKVIHEKVRRILREERT